MYQTAKDTLQEKTVAQLFEAGYEAYSINPSSYYDVQETLHTDFSAIGITPSNSYIIVVGDASDVSDSAPSSTTGSSFTHSYGGKTYTLRYLTITATDDSRYGKSSTVNVLKSNSRTLIENCLDTAISTYISSISTVLGTVASLTGLSVSNFNTAQESTLNMNAGTNWTRIYTQVWSSYDQLFLSTSCVEYASVRSSMNGMYYSASLNRYVSVPANERGNIIYSSNYSNVTWRKDSAVNGFLNSIVFHNLVGDVKYKYAGTVKITHAENF